MLSVEELQSATMRRTLKQTNRHAIVFVLYLLINCVLSKTSDAEGTPASPTLSAVKEAEKIVGRFLRNEAGATWLSDISKTRSAPLTTEDLMQEIRKVSRPGGKLWQATTTLSESFKEQEAKGIKAESILNQAENWKDIIAHIEDQDDIICLYRKNAGETEKKASDWKKFLRTVSPGYTVHLAIDTGRKYVICLKKIEVQDVTTEELPSSTQTPSTTLSSTSSSPVIEEASAHRKLSKTEAKPSTPVTPKKKKKEITASKAKLENSEENCGRDNSDDTEGNGDEDCNGNSKETENDDVENNEEVYDDEEEMPTEKRNKKNGKRKVEDDSRTEPEDQSAERKKISRRTFAPVTKYQPVDDNPSSSPGRYDPLASDEHDCNRPIILVVPGGYISTGYQPAESPGIAFKRNLGGLSWLPSPYVVPWPKIPQPPKFPLIKQPLINFPQMPPPPPYPNIPPANFVPFQQLNKIKPIVDHRVTLYRPSSRPIFSQSTQMVYQFPRERDQRLEWQDRSHGFAQEFQMDNRYGSRGHRTVYQGEVAKEKSDFVGDQKYGRDKYERGRKNGHPRSQTRDLIAVRKPTNQHRTLSPERRIPADNYSDINQKNVQLARQTFRARNAQRVQQFLQKYDNPQLRAVTPVFGDRSQFGADNYLRSQAGHNYLQSQAGRNYLQTQRGQNYPYSQPDKNYLQSQRGQNYPYSQSDQNYLQSQRDQNYFQSRSGKNDLSSTNVRTSADHMRPKIINRLREKPKVLNPYVNSYWKYPATQPDILTPIAVSPPRSNPLSPTSNRNSDLDGNIASAENGLVPSSARCNGPCFYPVAWYQLKLDRAPCSRSCDKPVQLKIVINGKVRDPLKVSVVSEPGQRVEIVGPDDRVIPYGSRSLRKKMHSDDDLEDLDEDIEEDIDDKEAESATERQDDEKKKEKKEEKERKVDQDNKPSFRNGLNETESKPTANLKNTSTTVAEVEIPTTTNASEPTSSSTGLEIGERFLDSVTLNSSPGITYTEANTTLPTVSNSSVAEMN